MDSTASVETAQTMDKPGEFPVPANCYAETVTMVQHYTDRLFRFRITRPKSFRFRSGEFVMIGLPNAARPVFRAYSVACPAWDEELEFFSIKVPNGPLTEHLQKIQPGDTVLMKQKATGTLVVDALLPDGVALGVVQGMDEQVWAAEPGLQADLRAALLLIEHSPPLFGVLGRFTRLGRTARQELLTRMLRSKREVFVQAVSGLKQMAQILYYSTDAVWDAIGYDGPWIKERKPPASALAYQKLLKERA